MKNKTLLAFVLLFGITTLFTNCSKEDPATTGGFTVKVKLDGSTGFLTNVLVGLATSEQNLDNSLYLQELDTDANGTADFGQLNPGNYFFDCYHIIGSDNYYGEGQVQITAGTDLEVTLSLL